MGILSQLTWYIHRASLGFFFSVLFLGCVHCFCYLLCVAILYKIIVQAGMNVTRLLEVRSLRSRGFLLVLVLQVAD